MSIFACSLCGCVENTACTKCSHGMMLMDNHLKNDPKKEALLGYKEALGLKPDEPFYGHQYCSACCPIWFNKKGEYGVGANPNPTPGAGLWHESFKRQYLPPGMFETNPNTGNLRKTGEEKDASSKILKKYLRNIKWTI